MDIERIKQILSRREQLDTELIALEPLGKLQEERAELDRELARITGAAAQETTTKRAVTCGSCGKQGHNSKTCPTANGHQAL